MDCEIDEVGIDPQTAAEILAHPAAAHLLDENRPPPRLHGPDRRPLLGEAEKDGSA